MSLRPCPRSDHAHQWAWRAMESSSHGALDRGLHDCGPPAVPPFPQRPHLFICLLIFQIRLHLPVYRQLVKHKYRCISVTWNSAPGSCWMLLERKRRPRCRTSRPICATWCVWVSAQVSLRCRSVTFRSAENELYAVESIQTISTVKCSRVCFPPKYFLTFNDRGIINSIYVLFVVQKVVDY